MMEGIFVKRDHDKRSVITKKTEGWAAWSLWLWRVARVREGGWRALAYIHEGPVMFSKKGL